MSTTKDLANNSMIVQVKAVDISQMPWIVIDLFNYVQSLFVMMRRLERMMDM